MCSMLSTYVASASPKMCYRSNPILVMLVVQLWVPLKFQEVDCGAWRTFGLNSRARRVPALWQLRSQYVCNKVGMRGRNSQKNFQEVRVRTAQCLLPLGPFPAHYLI